MLLTSLEVSTLFLTSIGDHSGCYECGYTLSISSQWCYLCQLHVQYRNVCFPLVFFRLRASVQFILSKALFHLPIRLLKFVCESSTHDQIIVCEEGTCRLSWPDLCWTIHHFYHNFLNEDDIKTVHISSIFHSPSSSSPITGEQSISY